MILGGSVSYIVLANVLGVVIRGTMQFYTHQLGVTHPMVGFYSLFLYWRMAGSHMQSVMRDFVHLLIHFGRIKPSTRCDRPSVALMSNVQC